VAPLESTTETGSGTARYAVVVATRNRGKKISALIESVVANVARDFEMVIVDQSTSDETKIAVAPFLADPRIRYVSSELAGTSRARNLGISLTSAPFIVITDDDCIVPVHWLGGLTQPFEDCPRVGVVFCNVDPVPVSTPGYTPHVHFPRNRTISTASMAWSSARRGLSLGAGMAIRRRVVQEVGGFDEVLGPGAIFGAAEDNDLSWRALIRGWWVYQNSEVTVLHDGLRTFDELRSLVERDFYGVGGTIAKYLKSGHWQVATLILSWLVWFGAVLPARDLFNRRLPRGFRRPYMLLRGLVAGLQRPLDPTTLCYRSTDHANGTRLVTG
jgi:GT2 family glycosyltransferase